MCRLLAVITDPLDTGLAYGSLMRLFELSGEHPHGWGVGYFVDGRAVVEREPKQGNRSEQARAAAGRALSATVIGHIRDASVGGHTVENTHPFTDGRWIFCHNGTIDIHGMLRRRLTSKRLDQLRGTTDSEIFFHWLLQNMEEQSDTTSGIEEAVRFILSKKGGKTTSLNFLLSDGSMTFACNLSFTKHHYFCLYRKRGLEVRGEDASSQQVCSQPLGAIDGWELMDNATLAIIGEGSKMRFEDIG